MRKIWVILLLVSLFLVAAGVAEQVEEAEEGYIYLRINRNYGDTFFPVLLRGDRREVYIGIEDFFETLGLRTLTYNPETDEITGELFYDDNGRIINKNYSGNIKNTKKIVKNNKIYVEAESLSKLLPMEYVVWEREKSLLEVTLKFLMPIQVRERQERLRQGLGSTEETEKKVLRNEKKVFSPGIAQVKYFNSDFSDREAEDTFEVNYYNQMLYGDLTLQSTLKPDQDVNFAALKYRDVIGENSVILGDATLQKESIISLDGNDFRGVSILKDDIFIESDRDTVTISGQVLNGTTVELYQWENLIEIEVVRTDNRFIFDKIPVIGFSDSYTLKFYYPDGSFEEREISILGDNDLQAKGENNFYLQVGELEDELTASTRYLYGVTDNLTLGAGFVKGKNSNERILDEDEEDEDDDEEEDRNKFTYSTVETDIIYRTKAKRSPTLYSLKLFTDIEEIEDDYIDPENSKSSRVSSRLSIKKTLLKHDFELFHDEYSKSIANSNESDRVYGLIIGNSNYKLSYSLSFQREEEFQGDTDRYRLNLRYPFTDNLRGTWNNDYYDYSYDEENRITSRFSLSYSGFEKVDVSGSILTTIEDSDNSETYEVRVSRKNRNLGKGDFDYYAFARYDSDSWEYGIGFEYFLFDWLSTPTILTNDNQEYGVSLDKTIILSDPFRKNINPNPDNAWIKGKIFIDENGNGQCDKEERGMEGVQVYNSRKESISDEEGNYLLTDVPHSMLYEFSVDPSSIDPLIRPLKEEYYMNLSPASGTVLDIPMVSVSAIMGYITFTDEDSLTERERRLAYQRTKVYLKKDGVIVKEDNAEIDGFYLLEDILPGSYQLEIKYLGERKYTVEDKVYDVDILTEEAGEFFEGFDFYMISDKEDDVENKKTSQELGNEQNSEIKVEETSKT